MKVRSLLCESWPNFFGEQEVAAWNPDDNKAKTKTLPL